MTTYFAHSGKLVDRSDWQRLDHHSDQVATLAMQRGGPIGLAETARLAGQFHDFGKHDPAFDGILQGRSVRLDHSTAGGAVLMERATPVTRVCAEVLAYAILGHHAGLSDRRNADHAMERRLESFRRGIAPEIWNAAQPDLLPVARELTALMRRDTAGFDLSIAARMVFSCLVDADFRDTEAFYTRIEGHTVDREWPLLADLLLQWRAAFDEYVNGFVVDTYLNRQRRDILAHIRARADMTPGLFTLTVPTGGGKTLASLGFALDHAALHGHRRIIFAIPFTSIIDQTATIFRDLLGEGLLEHHSAIDAEKPGQEGRDKLRLAMEDWAAPLVVTTNVQLFESLFAARPSRCRKLHNIAGSIIILDEAQSLPRTLLMPVLRMLEALCTHYGCSVVLCTATQPAFDSSQLPRGLALQGRELAPDPEALARSFRRAKIIQAGAMEDDALIEALRDTPQGFVIVNSRAHALELFDAAHKAGLEGLVHLTTRQYPMHRRRVLDDIRQRLKDREPCRLIATSLIEAGVDLDFPRGWRVEAGLDSCIQAAGRVNRNGKRPLAESTLTIFSAPGRSAPAVIAGLADAMRRVAARHDDLLSPAAIRDWFEEVYWKEGPEKLGQPLVDSLILSRSGTDFPFRTIAEQFRMIDNAMVPVIIPGEAAADEAIRQLGVGAIRSGRLARILQSYTVQVPSKARALLVENGKAAFAYEKLRGDQFCILEDGSLYDVASGLRWENADYLSVEASIL